LYVCEYVDNGYMYTYVVPFGLSIDSMTAAIAGFKFQLFNLRSWTDNLPTEKIKTPNIQRIAVLKAIILASYFIRSFPKDKFRSETILTLLFWSQTKHAYPADIVIQKYSTRFPRFSRHLTRVSRSGIF